jgi:hypothetical protein
MLKAVSTNMRQKCCGTYNLWTLFCIKRCDFLLLYKTIQITLLSVTTLHVYCNLIHGAQICKLLVAALKHRMFRNFRTVRACLVSGPHCLSVTWGRLKARVWPLRHSHSFSRCSLNQWRLKFLRCAAPRGVECTIEINIILRTCFNFRDVWGKKNKSA